MTKKTPADVANEKTASELLLEKANNQKEEEQKVFEMALHDAAKFIEEPTAIPAWESVTDDKLVSAKSITDLEDERAKKYLGNNIKICITYPYLIDTNKQMLKQQLEERNLTGWLDAELKNKIYGTVNQIKSIYAEIDALMNISKSYEDVLRKLQSI